MPRRLPQNEQLPHRVLVALNDTTCERLQAEAQWRDRPISAAVRMVLDEALLYAVPDSNEREGVER